MPEPAGEVQSGGIVIPMSTPPVEQLFRVGDVKTKNPDGAGRIVEHVFSKRLLYAIYQADNKVFIQYADDPTTADAQAQTVADLLCLRRKLEYLADGLTSNQYYNEQLASAFQVAFDHKPDVAKEALSIAIDNATEERARIGRQYYLIAAGTVSLVMAMILIGIGGSLKGGAAQTGLLLLTCGGGAIGALLSIAIAIRSRTVAPDHDWTTNLIDGVLRVGIGIISGFALHLLLTTGFITGASAGTVALTAAAGWKAALLIGLAAGFLERLVPDLLEKGQQKVSAAAKAGTTDPG